VAAYYYKTRMYAPTLGRFTQTDRVGYAAGLNLYAYVGNDPVNAIDSFGLQEFPPPTEEPPIVVTGAKRTRTPFTPPPPIQILSGSAVNSALNQRFATMTPGERAEAFGAGQFSTISDTGQSDATREEEGSCPTGRTNLFNLKDRYGMPVSNQFSAANPFPGSHLVTGHGTPRGVMGPDYEFMSARELAEHIKGTPGYSPGQNVTIAACRVGQNPALLQGVADALGACVAASTGYARYPRSGPIYATTSRAADDQARSPWRTACPQAFSQR
jgi:hypothetical protein